METKVTAVYVERETEEIKERTIYGFRNDDIMAWISLGQQIEGLNAMFCYGVYKTTDTKSYPVIVATIDDKSKTQLKEMNQKIKDVYGKALCRLNELKEMGVEHYKAHDILKDELKSFVMSLITGEEPIINLVDEIKLTA